MATGDKVGGIVESAYAVISFAAAIGQGEGHAAEVVGNWSNVNWHSGHGCSVVQQRYVNGRPLVRLVWELRYIHSRIESIASRRDGVQLGKISWAEMLVLVEGDAASLNCINEIGSIGLSTRSILFC